jgi:leucyl/phenylalanyl-tRNA--protein transferase
MSVYLLNENEVSFPNPELADDNGLLAIGGDLSVERLLLAYSNGIFPWYSEGEPILWWCPKERYIIRPSNIHVSHSMRKFMKKHSIKIVFNRDFKDTMHRCRMKREGDTWITDDMEEAYGNLHKEGYAISVEAMLDGETAGGLYGVCLGNGFFGESMFTDRENGSKLALIGLAKELEKSNIHLIDCQFHTEHLESMGGEYISYEEYMNMLNS